jgi:plastocyanin
MLSSSTMFALLALLAGCGLDTGPIGNTGSPAAVVTVSNNTFTPASVTVAVGETVKWSWAAGAANHNVTFDDGPASITKNNGTFTRTFGVAGTYGYECTIHGSAMAGTVVVQ